MEESSKRLVVNKQQLKNTIYVDIMANKDQQYLINRFIGIIADNFCNEDIVVNVITTICDEEISISESEPMDIF